MGEIILIFDVVWVDVGWFWFLEFDRGDKFLMMMFLWRVVCNKMVLIYVILW